MLTVIKVLIIVILIFVINYKCSKADKCINHFQSNNGDSTIYGLYIQ